jgi:hypothetical protein
MTVPAPAPFAVPRAGQFWMVTLIDLGFLILTFFIIQFSTMAVREEDWKAVARAVGARPDAVVAEVAEVSPAAGGGAATDLAYLEAVLAGQLAGEALFRDARWLRTPGELSLAIDAARLFADGGTALSDAALADLARLGEALRFVGNAVLVRATGAGDTKPETWLALLARGQAVADAISGGDPQGPPAVVVRLDGADTVEVVVRSTKEGSS